MNKGWTEFYTASDVYRYAVCFYYSVLTMAGEELAPVTNLQIIFAVIVVVAGALFSAFIFGNMAALQSQMNKKESMFDSTLDMVTETIKSL